MFKSDFLTSRKLVNKEEKPKIPRLNRQFLFVNDTDGHGIYIRIDTIKSVRERSSYAPSSEILYELGNEIKVVNASHSAEHIVSEIVSFKYI